MVHQMPCIHSNHIVCNSLWFDWYKLIFLYSYYFGFRQVFGLHFGKALEGFFIFFWLLLCGFFFHFLRHRLLFIIRQMLKTFCLFSVDQFFHRKRFQLLLCDNFLVLWQILISICSKYFEKLPQVHWSFFSINFYLCFFFIGGFNGRINNGINFDVVI